MLASFNLPIENAERIRAMLRAENVDNELTKELDRYIDTNNAISSVRKSFYQRRKVKVKR